MSRASNLAYRLSSAITPKPLEVCKQSLARMSMQGKVILRRRGMVKSEGNDWYVVHPRPSQAADILPG